MPSSLTPPHAAPTVIPQNSGTLEALPDVVPPDLYAFELGSQWERDALHSLLTAPLAPAPGSPPPLRRHQQPQALEAACSGGTAEPGAPGGGECAGGAAGARGSCSPGAGGGDDEAWQAWQIHQAWEVWEAWQKHYCAGVSGRDAAEGEHISAPRLLWQRRRAGSDAASSSSFGGSHVHMEGGGSCAGSGLLDGGSNGVGASASCSEIEELEPHARALLKGLAVRGG